MGRSQGMCLFRILEMLEYMRANNPKTEIVLLSLLPRGGQTDQTWWDWPNRFSKAIEIINAHQKNFAKTMEGVHYVDCTAPFLPNGKVSCSCPASPWIACWEQRHPESVDHQSSAIKHLCRFSMHHPANRNLLWQLGGVRNSSSAACH